MTDPLAEIIAGATEAATVMHRRHPWTQYDDLLSAALEGAATAWRDFDPANGGSVRGYGYARATRAIIDDWRRLHGRHGQRTTVPLGDEWEHPLCEDSHPCDVLAWLRPLTNIEQSICAMIADDIAPGDIDLRHGHSIGWHNRYLRELRTVAA